MVKSILILSNAERLAGETRALGRRRGRLLAPALLLLLMGCGQTRLPATGPAARRLAATAPATPRASGVYRFKIGNLDALVLYDGAGGVPNNGQVFGIDEGPERVAAMLRAAGRPADTLSLSINVLLVRTGQQVLLIDAGNGPAAGGKLPASLREAGVRPAEITDVIITHGHGDHVGGLVGAGGGAAFPNARVHPAAAEWAAVRRDPAAAAVVDAVDDRVVPFAPGAVFAAGITAVALPGHTPGHTAVQIESVGQRLLAIGDAAHHYVLSLREPEFTIAFDADAPLAETNRRALLNRAVEQGLLLYAPHFPYPGLGTVRREGSGFALVPLP